MRCEIIIVDTGCILRIDLDPQSLHSSLLLEPSIWEAHKTPRQGVDNVRVVGERRYRGSRLITLGEIYLIQMVPKPSLGTVPYFLCSDCSIELHDIFKRSEGSWLVIVVVQ